MLSTLKTATSAANAGAPKEETLAHIDGMITRMRGLKRKLEVLEEERELLNQQAKARILHMKELWSIPTMADVKYDDWSRVRLNRLLVDYMLRKGYINSAKALAKEKGIEPLVDVEVFARVNSIASSLRGGSLTEALSWCSEHKQLMKKSSGSSASSSLEFQLRFQQFIELKRGGQLLEARNYAYKHIAPHIDTHRDSVLSASALLVAPPETLMPAYASYFSLERWNMLASLFTTTHHELFSLSTCPLLHTALRAGLTALKTPSCHSVHASSASPSTNAHTQGASLNNTRLCPICSTELNELARDLPYAHHSQSLAENNAVVLPNHRIYGRDKLMEFSAKMGVPEQIVRDPVTQEDFSADELRKVFIM